MRIVTLVPFKNDRSSGYREGAVLNHSWRLSVKSALDKYFPGANVESDDSPYELTVIDQYDNIVGAIQFHDKKGEQEARAYLADQHGEKRARAILYGFNQDFHDEYIRPYQ